MPDISNPFSQNSWKSLYIAVLLEPDRDKMPLLIDDAEDAIVARGRELFKAAGDNTDEREALDDALYALKALRNCIIGQGRFHAAA